MLTGLNGEIGVSERTAAKRKYKLATLRNCSKIALGKNVTTLYFVVDIKFEQYFRGFFWWSSGWLQCITREP
jgi:hypothetical protein